MRLAARGLSVQRSGIFLGSSEGKKVLLFGAALSAVVFAILWGQLTRERRQLDLVTGKPAVPIVVVTAPPQAFVPAEVKHRLLAVDDLAEEFSLPGLRALLAHFAELHASSAMNPAKPTPAVGLPAAADVVDFHIAEALADPKAFRGGWVKTDGVVTTLWTEGLDDPDSTGGMLPLYRGILVENPQSTGVMFVTTKRPPDFTIVRDHVALRGVFLQTIRFKTQDEKIPYRIVPLLVVDEFVVVESAQGRTAQTNLLPVAVTIGAAAAVLIVFLILRRKSRRTAATGLTGRHLRKPNS